jgi:hypothetical protein
MPLASGGTAPYAPPATVIEVVTRYRERGLSTPFTSEVMERAGVPETLSNRTLQTLKLLELIDSEGNPTPEFEAASRAPDTDYKERMSELVLASYAEVINFADPASDSYERVRDAFRAYNPRGQQDRMVTLFLGLLDFVGLDTSKATASRRRAESAPSQTKANGSRATGKTISIPQAIKKRQPVSRASEDDQHESAGLPPGLLGLLRQIPRDGTGWTASRRDDFMAAFKAVLDFSVPVRDAEPAAHVEGPT